MARYDDKVVVISGAARGMGRAHAVRLASEGATIVAFDICGGFMYPMAPAATPEDLAETKRQVEELGQQCLARQLDARDLPALQQLADDVMAEFGRIDVVLVNHGIWSFARNSWELELESWQETIENNMSGAFKVQKAFAPKIIEAGNGGVIIFTTSANAKNPQAGAIHYSASKAAIEMMMKVLAYELGPYDIRVNTIAPGAIDTPIAEGGSAELAVSYNPKYWEFATQRAVLPGFRRPPSIIADAAAWLASDDARYVTGTTIRVDAGETV